jgi:hypothetical protein
MIWWGYKFGPPDLILDYSLVWRPKLLNPLGRYPSLTRYIREIFVPTGSAKTVMMKAFMKKANPDHYLSRSFNFSSATSPYQFQVIWFSIYFFTSPYQFQVISPYLAPGNKSRV